MDWKEEAKRLINELKKTMTTNEIREQMNLFSTGFLEMEKAGDLEKSAKFGRRAHY